jgi:hypothetical protein
MRGAGLTHVKSTHYVIEDNQVGIPMKVIGGSGLMVISVPGSM